MQQSTARRVRLCLGPAKVQSIGLGGRLRLRLPVDSFPYYMSLHWMLAGDPPGCPSRGSGGACTRRGTAGRQRSEPARSTIGAGSISHGSRNDSSQAPLGEDGAKGVDRDPKERA